MTVVHQFHHSVSRGDAVTNHMLLIRDVLRERGVEGCLLASDIRDGWLDGQVVAFSKARREPGDLLLIHHSQGNPSLPAILDWSIQKAVIYHNITPERFFRHDPFIERLCMLGRRQLTSLAQHVSTAFAVSELNALELEAHGFRRVRLLPLVDAESVGLKAGHSESRQEPARLLFVGKMAPHKNQALLVRMLHGLRRLMPEARLDLVGGQDPLYGRYVKALCRDLGLGAVVDFRGRVTDAELLTAYRKATAFVSASLHEGFCVPLVEAMAHGLPILAHAAAGVAATLGSGGVLIHTLDPLSFAASVFAWLSRPETKKNLSAAAGRRLVSLRQTQCRAALAQALGEWIHAPSQDGASRHGSGI